MADVGGARTVADGAAQATVEGFAVAARVLADATRAAGLAVPAFRSPPRIPGVARSLRRYPGGTVVSVRLRDRPLETVVADMVEGIVVTNRLSGEPALRARTYLAAAVSSPGAAPTPGPSGLASEQARVVERQTRAA